MEKKELQKTIINAVKAHHGLSIDGVERAVYYAKDLLDGLELLRKYEQGVTVFGSARIKPDSIYYTKAEELGRKLAENGVLVTTGGGPGVMEAVSKGAFEAGGQVLGLNIQLLFEQDLNAYVTDSMEFTYFFARKVMLVDSGKVFVYFPGGIGTLDECSEILELMQNDKITRAPVFLFGSEYWQPFNDLIRHFLEQDMITPEDVEIYKITDDIDEIVEVAKNTSARTIGDEVDRRNAERASLGVPVQIGNV
jgi:uncharacterized protein (TIGR00730 family)